MGFLLGSLRALGTSGAVFFPLGAVFWVALGVPLAVFFWGRFSLSFQRPRRFLVLPLLASFSVLGTPGASSDASGRFLACPRRPPGRLFFGFLSLSF